MGASLFWQSWMLKTLLPLRKLRKGSHRLLTLGWQDYDSIDSETQWDSLVIILYCYFPFSSGLH